MKDLVVNVYPGAGGWCMECDLPLEPIYFKSGGRAEAAARNLAIRLSCIGHEVRMIVKDGADQTVGSHRYHPLQGVA